MDFIKAAESALMFDVNDSISKVASEMWRTRRHEALVFDNRIYKGIIFARDLVKRNINDPDKIKIKNLKALIKSFRPFTENVTLREIIDTILINNYESVPFQKDGKFFTLTRLDLLKALPREVLKGKKASDVMTFPYCIGMNDSLAVAQSILKQTQVHNIAIVNDLDRVDGTIDSLDMLRGIVKKHGSRKGELAGEQIKLRQILASSHTLSQPRQVVLKVKPDTPLEEVRKRMLETKNSIAVVETEKLQGIVIPTYILKLLAKEVGGVYIRISGQQKEDVFIRSVIDEEIRNEIKKLGKFLPIDYMVIHIDRYKKTGKRVKYALKAQLISQKGMFFTHGHAWDLTQAVRIVLSRLEREIIKQKEKSETYTRGEVDHFTMSKVYPRRI